MKNVRTQQQALVYAYGTESAPRIGVFAKPGLSIMNLIITKPLAMKSANWAAACAPSGRFHLLSCRVPQTT